MDSLKKFLGVQNLDNEQIVYIDLICHGTSPSKLWDDYVIWLERKYNSRLREFYFRYPNSNNIPYYNVARFDDGTTIENRKELYYYNEIFFGCYLLRDCCEHCKYAAMQRCSDITLGDFWGIDSVLPKFPYHDKVSLILANTEKGKNIMYKIVEAARSDPYIIIEHCSTSKYIDFQERLKKPGKKNKNHKKFKKDYETRDFNYVLKKYTNYGMYNLLKTKIRKGIIIFCDCIGIKGHLKKIMKK